jgi:cell shape-determining protein MreC
MKFVAIILLLGYVVIDIILYFYIPIRNVLDDAANHFIAVYNTIAVLFTTLVLYVIIKQCSKSQIRVFTRAMDSLFYKDEKATHLNIKRRDWKGLSEKDKDTEVAKSLLKNFIYCCGLSCVPLAHVT